LHRLPPPPLVYILACVFVSHLRVFVIQASKAERGLDVAFIFTNWHWLEECGSSKHGIASHKPHTSSIDGHRSNTKQELQMHDKGSGHDTQASATASVGAGNNPGAGFVNDPQGHRITDSEDERQRLTPEILAQHQNEIARFHANPGLVLAAQQAQRASLEAAARTLGFDFPSSATNDCTGMTPVGRYIAEQVDGEGPWKAVTRRH
jgi:hypothetical protein